MNYSVKSGSTNQDGGRHQQLWVQGRLYYPKMPELPPACLHLLSPCEFFPAISETSQGLPLTASAALTKTLLFWGLVTRVLASPSTQDAWWPWGQCRAGAGRLALFFFF